MRCLHCGREIGWFRRITDRQFCCKDHRLKSRLAYSARLARDFEEDLDGWLISSGTKKKTSSFGPGPALLLAVACVFLVMFLPSGDSGPVAPALSYLPPTRTFSDKLARSLPSTGSLSLREEFAVDLRNWQSSLIAAKDGWRQRGRGLIEVGKLRLWKPTLTLADYNLEFEAQIEAKAVGWAYRATDPNNFYATKIHLSRQGTSQRAEIVRFVMVGGKPLGKAQLPIPVVVKDKMIYGVRVAVAGDRFTTTINGQVVDSWRDRRYTRGGIGFFSEPGEKALLRWVAVSEPKGVLERLLSFGLILPPSATLR